MYVRQLGVGSEWRVNSMENRDEHEMCNDENAGSCMGEEGWGEL